MRSIVLIGEPGSGKSRFLCDLRHQLGYRRWFYWGLLDFEWYREAKVLVIGRWDTDSPTPGADQLVPEAGDWLRLLVLHARHLSLEDFTVCLDGHKLLSPALMTTLRNHTDHTLIRLAVSEQTRQERQQQRAGGQMAPDYQQALSVRYDWLCATYEPSETWCNETEADYERNLVRLCALVGLSEREEVA